MKNLFALLLVVALVFAFGCADTKEIDPSARFIVRGLPAGIEAYQFEEEYDKPYGRWSVNFLMKNNTGKKIEFPELDADLFLNGEKVFTAVGGPGKALTPGDSGVVTWSYIMPKL